MALSGSRDWTLTRDNIITEMLRRLKKIGVDQTASAEQIADGSITLNIIFKAWQNKVTFFNSIDWTQKTFTASTVITGTDNLNYTCIKGLTSSASDRPITGANWSTYYKQTGTGGIAWVTATPHTSIGDFDLDSDTIDIRRPFIRYAGIDYPFTRVAEMKDYLEITDKTVTGRPRLIAIDRQLTPHLYLFPQPANTNYVLHYTRIRKLQDFDAAANNADLPDSALQALVSELTYRSSFKYPVGDEVKKMLKADAEKDFLMLPSIDSRWGSAGI